MSTWFINVDPVYKRPKFLEFLLNLNFWKIYSNSTVVILDPNDEYLWKTFCDRSLKKKTFFFLRFPPPQILFAFSSIAFLEFESKSHQISSIDFKFHLKICIRSGVITFWTFARILTTCSKNSKRYNS